MNVFVLCSGRCGSVTISRACQHMTNYTSSHESHAGLLGKKRVIFPDNHIEIDNRLSWFLGKLDKEYRDKPTKYARLSRDFDETAISYSKRFQSIHGIMFGYAFSIYRNLNKNVRTFQVARDYVETVYSNIDLFLKDKEYVDIRLENFQEDYIKFWDFIGAEGDLNKALEILNKKHNSS